VTSFEKLVGITLDEAIGIAESNPLGMDEIFYRVRNAVLGRLLHLQRRRSSPAGCLWTPVFRSPFKPEELAALLNRAGGEAA